jgi:hypothetical protein
MPGGVSGWKVHGSVMRRLDNAYGVSCGNANGLDGQVLGGTEAKGMH